MESCSQTGINSVLANVDFIMLVVLGPVGCLQINSVLTETKQLAANFLPICVHVWYIVNSVDCTPMFII